ncbi:MAG TPA: DNA topoisomerase [Clostridiales bacterium]|nr:DNA topoisomerase [Clostridiales bacterium]
MAAEKTRNTKEYGNESITQLKGADRVRKRPSMIFGSDGLEGCQHSFFEILSNSIDEAREGYGNVIEVARFKDGSLMVRDYGRGIPLDYNPREDRYNWELVYCELYAGGKYNTNEGENYQYSLGLNGLGACATQYSSESFDVEVIKDGFRYRLHFEKGENIGGLTKDKIAGKKTGSMQRWKPDREVFTDIAIPLSYFQDTLRKQAIVNAGLTLKLTDEESGQVFEYRYEEGIRGYLAEVAGDKAFTGICLFEGEDRGRDREDKPEYKVKFQVAFCFCNEVNLLEYYHNSSFLEHGGSPDRAVRSAFVSEMDKFLKTRGKYNKDESRIGFSDIQDSLVLVSNTFSTMTSYENQTKKAISNRFIQEAMAEFLKKNLEIFFIEQMAEGEKALAQVLVNKRSREAAEKTRLSIKKKFSSGIDITNRIKKFVDCRTRDLSRRELYIVEGDSALGSCKLGRDAEFQAIMPVRGKILNCLKAEYNKILKNEIITDLIKVLGCGLEAKTRHARDLEPFNPDNLRWDKIIICTDADVDGYQIRTLILAMLYRLVPGLITMGKVYIAESPLFEINDGKQTFFAYTEKEKAEILAGLKGRVTLQRSKGLGENEPEMMWQTTMNPETRRLVKVMPEEAEHTAMVFDLFLGDDLDGRKTFIENNGHMYLEMIDIS